MANTMSKRIMTAVGLLSRALCLLQLASAFVFIVIAPRATKVPRPVSPTTSNTLSFTTGTIRSLFVLQVASTPTSWEELEHDDALRSPLAVQQPSSIDSALSIVKSPYSTTHPTLFRERHGWCPYSERVWLAMEEIGNGMSTSRSNSIMMDYDTVRVDNMGAGASAPRPISGQTPQLFWPTTKRMQGESMDIVESLDTAYNDGNFQSQSKHCRHVIQQFRSIFPQRARPSSRAAFLFQGNGEPLWRSVFEETLQKTNALLQQTSSEGPFFCGAAFSAADIAWAPFLERYRYQLPCLHENLYPMVEDCRTSTGHDNHDDDDEKYPHLTKWYHAMESSMVPSYPCRVKGDASSWRKVLVMAGFGNAGIPPQLEANMDVFKQHEVRMAMKTIQQENSLGVWDTYASTRPHVAATPQAEAAAIIVRNRSAILKDAITKRYWTNDNISFEELDQALRGLVQVLLQMSNNTIDDIKSNNDDNNNEDVMVQRMARFLDDRMCVPRDMGAMSAAAIKIVAYS